MNGRKNFDILFKKKLKPHSNIQNDTNEKQRVNESIYATSL